ncbi:MAG: DUF445 family protein [Spirochaetaceae bacterium]
MTSIEPYLPYLIPPLLGAIIGYVTNYIAIRMLFRPLTEKRVLGMRIPFTPGIIPRQRVALAESIGKMVSTQLITEETVRGHLQGEGFQARAAEAVGGATESLLDRPIDAHILKGTVRDIFSGGGSFRSPGTAAGAGPHRIVVAFVDAVIETLGTVRLRRFLPEGEARGKAIRDGYRRLLEGPLRESLKEAANHWADRESEEGATLAVLLPEKSDEMILELANHLYDPALEALVRWLKEPAVRREMETRGRGLVRDIVERLTIFQRFLVTAAQYDRRLDETMPDIVSDAIASLEDAGRRSENRAMVLAGIRTFVARLKEIPLDSAADSAGVNPRKALDWLVDRLVDLLESPTAEDAVVSSTLGRLVALEDKTLLDIGRLLTRGDEEATRRELRIRVLGAIEGGPGNVPRVVETLLDGLHGVTLRDLVTLEPGTKEKIDGRIADGLLKMTERHLPSIVAAMDVYGLVVNRINALDVADVERLLLMVIAKHLKWINLFGALLGAIIGGTQIAASRLW